MLTFSYALSASSLSQWIHRISSGSSQVQGKELLFSVPQGEKLHIEAVKRVQVYPSRETKHVFIDTFHIALHMKNKIQNSTQLYL